MINIALTALILSLGVPEDEADDVLKRFYSKHASKEVKNESASTYIAMVREVL